MEKLPTIKPGPKVPLEGLLMWVEIFVYFFLLQISLVPRTMSDIKNMLTQYLLIN